MVSGGSDSGCSGSSGISRCRAGEIELICDEELGEAVQRIVAAAVAADTTSVVQQTCRMVGFARTTDGMKTRVEQVIQGLVSRGILVRNSNTLSLAG